MQGCKPPSTPVPICKLTTLGAHPFLPLITPSIPKSLCTHVTRFTSARWHRHIGILLGPIKSVPNSPVGSTVLAALFWQSCPDTPVLAVLSSSSFLAVLYWRLVLPVLFWMSCYCCPVPADLFLLSCSSWPFLAVLSFLNLVVLCWQPYPCSPALAVLSKLFCPGNTIIAALLWLSQTGYPV